MFRPLIAALGLSLLATPAVADTRYLAYDASDRITTALTRGVTLEIERGLFGSVAVRRLISTSQRGSAEIQRGGPDEARRSLPEGARDGRVYAIAPEGDGRGLSRALCPSADESFLVIGRVRAGHPLTIEAVGRWADGRFRHCVTLSYDYRGEWAMPPRAAGEAEGSLAPRRPD